MSDSDSDLGELCEGLDIKKLTSPNTNSDNEFEIDGLLSEFDNLKLISTNDQRMENMNAAQLDAVITAAVTNALAAQKNDFEQRLQEITSQIQAAGAPVPQVQSYSPITIDRRVACDESLDAVKSLPEFHGSQEQYVSWRQAQKLPIPFMKVLQAIQGTIRRCSSLGTRSGTLRTQHWLLLTQC